MQRLEFQARQLRGPTSNHHSEMRAAMKEGGRGDWQGGEERQKRQCVSLRGRAS